MRKEGRERGGVVSYHVRAVQLLGSISETSCRSSGSRADILRQGWTRWRTKPSSLQDGWEAPLHRYFTTAHICLFMPAPSPSISLIPAYSAPFMLLLKEPFLHTRAAAAVRGLYTVERFCAAFLCRKCAPARSKAGNRDGSLEPFWL